MTLGDLDARIKQVRSDSPGSGQKAANNHFPRDNVWVMFGHLGSIWWGPSGPEGANGAPATRAEGRTPSSYSHEKETAQRKKPCTKREQTRPKWP